MSFEDISPEELASRLERVEGGEPAAWVTRDMPVGQEEALEAGLELGTSLRRLAAVPEPGAEVLGRARRRVMASLAPAPTPGPRRRAAAVRFPRWRLRLGGLALAGALLGGSAVTAAAQSLPGSPLFALRHAWEVARFDLEGSSGARASLAAELAQGYASDARHALASHDAPAAKASLAQASSWLSRAVASLPAGPQAASAVAAQASSIAQTAEQVTQAGGLPTQSAQEIESSAGDEQKAASSAPSPPPPAHAVVPPSSPRPGDSGSPAASGEGGGDSQEQGAHPSPMPRPSSDYSPAPSHGDSENGHGPKGQASPTPSPGWGGDGQGQQH